MNLEDSHLEEKEGIKGRESCLEKERNMKKGARTRRRKEEKGSAGQAQNLSNNEGNGTVTELSGCYPKQN